MEEEGQLEVDGRTVLYVVGVAVIDSSCCGEGGCRYALVPGYVRNLKTRRNADGLWVSEVESITDPKAKQEISQKLKNMEAIQQVQFDW
jgi:hypothetical protein